ncbi:hypothetical protein [Salinibacter altiplanensis]|uniref:hypothetical protein n=1 Tax=Salinibacter altiplanensis TaxID=1803181 RepID=UPI000C9FF699|nr:hypothetical protein [Salinibacter altiplanensis]
MLDSLLTLRSRFGSLLASRSTLERIGLLAGVFFLVYPPVEALLGTLPPKWIGTPVGEWSTAFFVRVGFTSVLWGVGMHYAEKEGLLSFKSENPEPGNPESES